MLAVPMREGMMTMPSHVMFVLNSAPAFLYFLCYIIVLFLWAEVILTSGRKHDLRDPSLKIKELRPVFYAIWLFIWIALVTLYVLVRPGARAHTHTHASRAAASLTFARRTLSCSKATAWK